LSQKQKKIQFSRSWELKNARPGQVFRFKGFTVIF